MALDLDSSLPLVPCVQSAIGQVILNLVVNAAHAIADVADETHKGTISVSSSCTETTAIVSIADTGTGIPDALRQRIFDPFFTTKKVGKGTGQGLAIAHAIICEQHNGSITVESEPGKGTCFRIVLPLVDAQQTDNEAAA